MSTQEQMPRPGLPVWNPNTVPCPPRGYPSPHRTGTQAAPRGRDHSLMVPAEPPGPPEQEAQSRRPHPPLPAFPHGLSALTRRTHCPAPPALGEGPSPTTPHIREHPGPRKGPPSAERKLFLPNIYLAPGRAAGVGGRVKVQHSFQHLL